MNGRQKSTVLWTSLLLGLALSACAKATDSPDAAFHTGEVGQIVRLESGGFYLDIIPSELDEMLQAKDFFS